MSKITESARGETCAIRGPSCIGGTETTVFAHSNFSSHGKGMGIKANSLFGMYACAACHSDYDGRSGNLTPYEKRTIFIRAHAETLLKLVEKGLVIVKD